MNLCTKSWLEEEEENSLHSAPQIVFSTPGRALSEAVSFRLPEAEGVIHSYFICLSTADTFLLRLIFLTLSKTYRKIGVQAVDNLSMHGSTAASLKTAKPFFSCLKRSALMRRLLKDGRVHRVRQQLKWNFWIKNRFRSRSKNYWNELQVSKTYSLNYSLYIDLPIKYSKAHAFVGWTIIRTCHLKQTDTHWWIL